MFSVCKNLTGLPGSEFWHLLEPPSSPAQATTSQELEVPWMSSSNDSSSSSTQPSSPPSPSSPSPSPGRQGVGSQARGPGNTGALRVFPPVPRVPVGSRSPGATMTTMITSQRPPLSSLPSSPPPPPVTLSQQSRSPRSALPLRINTSAHNEQLPRATPQHVSGWEEHGTPYRPGDENSGYYNQQQRHRQHQHQHQQGQRTTRPVRNMTPLREPPPRPLRYDAAREHDDGTGAYRRYVDRTAVWPAMPGSSAPEALHIPPLSMTDSRRQRQQRQPAPAPLAFETLQYPNRTQQEQPASTPGGHYHSYNDGNNKKKNNNNNGGLDSNGVSPLSSPGSSVDGDGNGQLWRDHVVSPLSSP